MARRGHRPNQAQAGRPRFYGRHAVIAALANPERTVRKLWGTREALGALDLPPVIPITYADPADLASGREPERVQRRGDRALCGGGAGLNIRGRM
jgi:hypothetical protein